MGVPVSDPVTATTAAQNSTGLGVTSGAGPDLPHQKGPSSILSGADLEVQEGIRNWWVMCTGTPMGGWEPLHQFYLGHLPAVSVCVCAAQVSFQVSTLFFLTLPSSRMKAAMPGFLFVLSNSLPGTSD